MTFRRFFIWLIERAVELQLAIACLIAVKFLLPVSDASYASLETFTAAVRETLRTNLDEAGFITRAFMDGDRGLYLWKTWLASAYTLGFFVYLQGLYLFSSLLARRISQGRDTLYALAAFLLSFVLICALFVIGHDGLPDMTSVRLALCLLMAGLMVVTLSAQLGKLLGGQSVPAKPVRPATFRAQPFTEDLPAVAEARPSVFRRERLYFSE
ncbi:hypothetical protein [Asticcacaulis benevestitus]|uniref:Uncharacterized protein n=1 Tax=Asticcacaulis benevestitus DSM 16100 = ATCC BAA-896 TaxID=1121022 RepID=V4RTY4_9CAUL|nr:hypothetical protein [Asticcacaulis benevestitus]ESQ94618.1 hypothetical protein ABENE_00565 [Asticcacaulis benevestitus DSM 16100 = ATCC BAA-896]